MAISQWMSVDVKERMRSSQLLQIIDVRQPGEFRSGHIPGAKLIPLGELPARYKEIDPNGESVIVCASGGRSSTACQMLGSMGYTKVHNLMGGMSGWDGHVE